MFTATTLERDDVRRFFTAISRNKSNLFARIHSKYEAHHHETVARSPNVRASTRCWCEIFGFAQSKCVWQCELIWIAIERTFVSVALIIFVVIICTVVAVNNLIMCFWLATLRIFLFRFPSLSHLCPSIN